MMGLVIFIHVVVCILLVSIVLIQAGRGGGLVEGFSGVESMFGTKTNALLTRTTTVLAVIFFLTCLSLAFLSIRQGRSLMRGVKPTTKQEVNLPVQSVEPLAAGAPASHQATLTPAQPPETQQDTEVPAAATEDIPSIP